jgi:hypothetical protein
VLPLTEIVEWGYSFLRINYPNIFYDKYKVIPDENFINFIHSICEKFNFIKNDSQIDTGRAIVFLYDDWKNNLRVNYEK